ncbi:MAG: hypothetical protein ACK4YU_09025 [Paracoccus sp. (in: a-proteobacteria)]
MIRAHMATFPARAGILMQAVHSILPQVDRLCICLNQYDDVPAALADEPKIEAMIPDRDLKDAGKFAFEPAPDDWVFTIDDDILYPPDYVATTLSFFDQLDPMTNIVGHLGNAWIAKGKLGQMGWKNFMFHKRAPHLLKVDLLGTGTTCQLGRNLPRLSQIEDAAGYVDLRHAWLQAEAGRWLWVLPHPEAWMTSTMTDELRDSSLFETVNRVEPPLMRAELSAVLSKRTPHSGEHYARLVAQGLLVPRARAGDAI